MDLLGYEFDELFSRERCLGLLVLVEVSTRGQKRLTCAEWKRLVKQFGESQRDEKRIPVGVKSCFTHHLGVERGMKASAFQMTTFNPKSTWVTTVGAIHITIGVFLVSFPCAH